MATLLNKTVVRKCAKPLNGKALIVQLEPGDMITMRQSGMRSGYTISLEGLYYHMVKSSIEKTKPAKRQLANRGIFQ